VLRRSAALAGGELSARAVGFLVVLVLARRLDPEGLGVVTLGLTLVSMFAIVVDAGTETLTMRDVSRRPDDLKRISERVLGLRLALSVLSAGLFVVGVELFARSEAVKSTVILFAFLLPAIALNLRWIVLGVGGVRSIAAGNLAARVVALIGALLLVGSPEDVQRVPFLELASELTYALAVGVFVFRREGPIRPRVDLAFWRTTLIEGSPLMASAVARSARLLVDVILIEILLGPGDLGIYAVASKPVAVVAGLVGLFAVSFMATFSATSPGAASTVHRRAQRGLIFLCVPAALALGLASPLIPIVFGSEYDESVVVLILVAWRLPFNALGMLYGQVLVVRNRQRRLLLNNVVAAAVVTAAEVPAILAFGLIGAAVVSVAGVAIFALLNYRSVRAEFPELLGKGASEP
jgi:O-antigen/teichoic acid export membrane protein